MLQEPYLMSESNSSNDNTFCIGAIAGIKSNKANVIFSGETTPSQKLYPMLEGPAYQLGDKVLLVKYAGSFIILGKIM